VKEINTVLAIDTSTDSLGVAIWCPETDKSFVVSKSVFRNQSSMLHTVLRDILDKNGIKRQDIGLIVCTKGPGSFTGVRIGLSAAQGLAYGLNVPLTAISTFEALSPPNKAASVWIEAARGEVYTQNLDENARSVTNADVLPLEEAVKQLKNSQKLCICGDIDLPEGMQRQQVTVDPIILAQRGYKKYLEDGETDIAPLYLSKLKYRKKNDV
jgi:tRNA threonylcarbamoyl adenosine modification protein YeaZ